jgi:hypothetical protein
MNKTGRLNCLADFVRDNKLDFVGIMETKKVALAGSSLGVVSRNVAWHVVPAKGTVGGILVGLKESSFSMLSCQDFKFGTTIMVKNNVDDFVWRLVVIYGPPYDEKKVEFLEELHIIMEGWQGPTILGGDSNIVRSHKKVMG